MIGKAENGRGETRRSRDGATGGGSSTRSGVHQGRTERHVTFWVRITVHGDTQNSEMFPRRKHCNGMKMPQREIEVEAGWVERRLDQITG